MSFKDFKWYLREAFKKSVTFVILKKWVKKLKNPWKKFKKKTKKCNGRYILAFALFLVESLCSQLFVGKLNYLTLTDPSKVWMPDTFFRNEKEASSVVQYRCTVVQNQFFFRPRSTRSSCPMSMFESIPTEIFSIV